MADMGTVKVDAREAMVTVRITHHRRLWLGLWLIRIGQWLSGARVEIV